MEKPNVKPLHAKSLNLIQDKLAERIHKLHLKKYNGNNYHFAAAVGCHESTIRKIVKGNQNITVIMLYKIAHALETHVAELIKDL